MAYYQGYDIENADRERLEEYEWQIEKAIKEIDNLENPSKNILIEYGMLQEVLKKVKEKLNAKVGRPAIGVSKRIAITLTEEQWEHVNEAVEKNGISYSKYFRGLVEEKMKREVNHG